MSAPSGLPAIALGIVAVVGLISLWSWLGIGLIPWIFTLLSIIGAVLNARGKKSGFVVWIISNIGWVSWNIYIKEYAQCLLFLVYTGTSSYGLYKWSKDGNR